MKWCFRDLQPFRNSGKNWKNAPQDKETISGVKICKKQNGELIPGKFEIELNQKIGKKINLELRLK